MKYTSIAAAAAVSFALVLPASAQMVDQTAKTGGKTGTTMQTENSKPMASGSMAMSGDNKMDGMAMKPMKKSKKSKMMMKDKAMSDKTMTDGAMKSDDGMKH